MTEFGLQLPDLSEIEPERRFARAAELTVSAEASGFDSVWVLDHHVRLPPSGPPERPLLEAYSLLGALASRTSRVRLGALVCDVDSRSPGMLAKVATSFDVIADGRTALGIEAAGIEVGGNGADGRVDYEVLEEAVRICRTMFANDDVSFAGEHFHLDHARNVPRPAQSGGPKILITASDESHVLSLVARFADVCGTTGSARTLARTIELLGRHCQEIGRDPTEIDVAWWTPCILTTSDEHSHAVRGALGTDGGRRRQAGVLVGQPEELPLLVAGHVAAGAGEVIFDISDADPSSIAAVGGALGLTTSARPTSGKDLHCR